tara:strand:+ start:69 stop:827 length:759 start_codon:yes stop_codon:yes gene_type:complete
MHKFFAKTQFLGKTVIYLPQCHSTNTEIQTFLKKMTLNEGSILVTDFQINGRGQQNNKWLSQKGKNILMSILLKPTFLRLNKQFYLNIITCLATTDALEVFTGNNLKIKWPNDIYAGINKIAGILLEASVSKRNIDHTIIGLGVNINQQEFGGLKATSVLLETGSTQRIDDIMELILLSLEKWYQKLKNRDYEEIILRYHSLLFWRNEKHVFYIRGELIDGQIKGINNRGQLIVEIKGVNQIFNNKELVFVE